MRKLFFWRRRRPSGTWHIDDFGRTRCLNCACLVRVCNLLIRLQPEGLPGTFLHTDEAMTCCECEEQQ